MQSPQEQTSGRMEPMETEEKGQKEPEGIKIPVTHEKWFTYVNRKLVNGPNIEKKNSSLK